MTLENHQKYLKYSPKKAKNILKLKVTAKKKKKKWKKKTNLVKNVPVKIRLP